MGSQRPLIVFGIGLAVLAACADAKPKKTTPLPPPPPPPPAPVVYIPPRPTPPQGAAANATIPPLNAAGQRQTINTGISPNQTVWNFRSAYNVAALNCMKPEHAAILVGYKAFLKTHRVGLNRANLGVNTEFRARTGASYVRAREAYMTKVYNFYAFPPTVARFCDAALVMARESMTVKPAELTAFSKRNLTTLDVVFENFYRAYEQYRADAAAWDAKYSPTPVVPAPVATPLPLLTPTPTPTPTLAPKTGK